MKKRISSFFKRHLAFNVFGLAVLFICIEGIYSFCSKPKAINCPEFNDANFDAWFPYQPGQALHFASSLQHKDSLTIQTVFKNTAYSGSGDCAMSAQILSQQRWNTTNRLFIDYHDNGSNTGMLFLSLDNFGVNGNLQQSRFVTLPQEPHVKSSFAANTIIDGHSFSNVIEIYMDTAVFHQEGVYKVWLSRQAGLIGYERYPTLEQFVKQ